jgi:diguanylate cyclase (GGDEF)-like protein
MGLGRKLALLQVVLIVSFIAAMVLIGQSVWNESYLRIEQDEVNDNVIRTRLAWEEELNVLGSLVGDWAPWDDLYTFASDPTDSEFVTKNLSDSSLANIKVNAAIVTDPQGRIVFAKAIDLARKEEARVPVGLLHAIEKLAGDKSFRLEGDMNLKSFVVVDGQPVLFSIQRILTSDKKGPSPGMFVFARYGNKALFAEIRRRTQVRVGFVGEAALPATTGAGLVRRAVGNDTVKAYYPLYDAFEGKGYYLASTTPRTIYRQGQTQLNTFMMAVAVFGVLLTGLTLLGLDRLVLSRVRRMKAFLNSVTAKKDYSVRLDLPGSDELSSSAAAMNAMLKEIETSHTEINALLASLRRELADRKAAEESLRYLSTHDALTGLRNRTFFEEELPRIAARHPRGVGIISCDLDGLKLINDTMGHAVGDRVLREMAAILREAVADSGFVARLGGDEFVAVMTEVGEQDVMKAVRRMRRTVDLKAFGGVGLKLSLSVGWAYQGGAVNTEEALRSLVRQADDFMYRRKLSGSQSNRNALVHGMVEMLKVRDFITEGHFRRLHRHVVAMGKLLGFNDARITDLSLLAQFHDIGKVGISDALLFKPGPLTAEERQEMERHAEIGHRIAQSVPELFPIGDFILKHHEWWNGRGYPLGLQGEEIPVECRILAIADAYDAMTNDRPYRPALTPAEAVAELRRFAGVQFDPELVDKFIGEVLNQAE